MKQIELLNVHIEVQEFDGGKAIVVNELDKDGDPFNAYVVRVTDENATQLGELLKGSPITVVPASAMPNAQAA